MNAQSYERRAYEIGFALDENGERRPQTDAERARFSRLLADSFQRTAEALERIEAINARIREDAAEWGRTELPKLRAKLLGGTMISREHLEDGIVTIAEAEAAGFEFVEWRGLMRRREAA